MTTPTTTTNDTVAPPAASEEVSTKRFARLLRLQALQIIIVLALILIVFSVASPNHFLTVFNIRGIVVNTSILAVLGVGMTFVIITGGIDLSVGSVLVFSGVVARQGHGRRRRAGLGRRPGRPRRRRGLRAGLGRAERVPDRPGQGATVDRHPRHPRHGARTGAGHHQGRRPA